MFGFCLQERRVLLVGFGKVILCLQAIGQPLFGGKHRERAGRKRRVFSCLGKERLIGFGRLLVVTRCGVSAEPLAELEIGLRDPALDFPVVRCAGPASDTCKQILERLGDGLGFVRLPLGGERANLLLKLTPQTDIDAEEFLLGIATVAEGRFEGGHHCLGLLAVGRLRREIRSQGDFVGFLHKHGTLRRR